MIRLLARLSLLVLVLLVSQTARAKDGSDHYAGDDGLLIHYQSWGQGSPVILIHGFTLDGSFWSAQVPALAKSHQVIVVDLPGHGDSGKPRDAAYTMDFYAAAVEAVARDAGLSHAALVGHSMGLPIIHTLLRRGKLKVDKVVAIDGAIMAQPADAQAKAAQQAWMTGMIEGLRSPGYQLVLEQFFQTFTTKVSPAQKKRLLAKVHDIDQHVALSTFEHFADADVWAPARHDVPFLGLYAALSGAAAKDWLAKTYPKSTLVIWDDVDHFPQLTQPARVNKAIGDFLK